MNVMELNDFSYKIKTAKEQVKRKLILTSELHGYDEQREQVSNIIKRTVLFSESDSLLLIGPRGCGKTCLVKQCLKNLEKECGKTEDYIVINLSGLVHTDDNLALKDIIQQLHVDELDGDRITGSFSDNLFFVLQSLRSGNRDTSKAVIFILDEFHLFCGHRNQTLLYNLFDVAQSAQAPICVIGITPRIDITEMLEKRVKSRFSHRQILLFPNFNIGDRLMLITDYLSLPEISKFIVKPLDLNFSRTWNDKVSEVFKTKKVILFVKKQLEFDPSESVLKCWLLQLVSRISPDSPFITEESVVSIIGTSKDCKVELLTDLSVLEFCLVIAMTHHNEIYDGDPFNFEIIFKRYSKFASQNYAAQIAQRPIVLKSFERLAEIELITPIGGGSKAFKKEYQLFNLLLTKTQVTEAANQYPGLPTDVGQWAASSVFNM